MLVMFFVNFGALLYILAHHSKNWVIGLNFKRSDQIVCTCFHECLKTTLDAKKSFGKTGASVGEFYRPNIEII